MLEGKMFLSHVLENYICSSKYHVNITILINKEQVL